jgi:hypothetical protein
MKTIALILTVLLAGCNLAIAQSPYATRLPAELQTAQMDSLADVTWLQGTTPAIRVEPLLRGRPVAVDADTTVRMVIGPSATGTLYAARTNLAAVTNAYEIQWPTIGTNSAGEAWFYTLLFDRAGYTYWSGSGKLYIEETTSTASNGLAWIEYTTPNVGWANVVGDPADNAALVQYVEAHGGGSTEDTVARAAVAGVESNLTAHVSDTNNPHGVTAEQLGALTAEEAEVLLATATNALLDLAGTRAMTGNLNMGGRSISNVVELVSHDGLALDISEQNEVRWGGSYAILHDGGTNVWAGRVNDTEASRIVADTLDLAGTRAMTGNVVTLARDIKSRDAVSVGVAGAAFGNSTTAGLAGAAFGDGTTAGDYGAAFGVGTTAGDYGAAFGDGTTAGDYGAAFGYGTTAGFAGAAFGAGTTAGDNGAAFGVGTTAGFAGAAFGVGTTAGKYGFSAGRYAHGSTGSFVFADSAPVAFDRTNSPNSFSVRAAGGTYFDTPLFTVTGEVAAARIALGTNAAVSDWPSGSGGNLTATNTPTSGQMLYASGTDNDTLYWGNAPEGGGTGGEAASMVITQMPYLAQALVTGTVVGVYDNANVGFTETLLFGNANSNSFVFEELNAGTVTGLTTLANSTTQGILSATTAGTKITNGCVLRIGGASYGIQALTGGTNVTFLPALNSNTSYAVDSVRGISHTSVALHQGAAGTTNGPFVDLAAGNKNWFGHLGRPRRHDDLRDGLWRLDLEVDGLRSDVGRSRGRE